MQMGNYTFQSVGQVCCNKLVVQLKKYSSKDISELVENDQSCVEFSQMDNPLDITGVPAGFELIYNPDHIPKTRPNGVGLLEGLSNSTPGRGHLDGNSNHIFFYNIAMKNLWSGGIAGPPFESTAVSEVELYVRY